MDETIGSSFSDHVTGRRKVHLRRIFCEGFQRDDGLIDIEGTLIDEKPFPIEMAQKSLGANEPIHLMTMCLTIDRQLVIRAVLAHMKHAPYLQCGEIVSHYQDLIGLRIEPGFTRQAKRMFRGTAGCSHMTELLPSIATTAFQILWNEPDRPVPEVKTKDRPSHSPLDGCATLRLDGEVVRLHFPHLLKR